MTTKAHMRIKTGNGNGIVEFITEDWLELRDVMEKGYYKGKRVISLSWI